MPKNPKVPEHGDLRLWWIPNPPREPFHVAVKTITEATCVFEALSNYDLYLGELIQANAGGLEVYDEKTGEWEEWEDSNGRPFGEVSGELFGLDHG